MFVCASVAAATAARAQDEIDGPPAPQGVERSVRVTLVPDHNYSSPPSLMEAVDTGDGVSWRHVCVAPCGVAVDPNGTFKVQGDSWRQVPNVYPDGTPAPGSHTAPDKTLASSTFHLPDASSEQTLSIHRGDKGLKVLGYVYAATAVPLLAVGGVAIGGGFGKDLQGALGVPLGGLGLAFAAVGIPLIVLVSTKVYDTTGHRIANGGPALTPTGFVF
jgi:hypothetical protein